MSSVGIESIRFNNMVIPTDGQGRLLINYRGGMKTFDYISAADVLARKLPPDSLRGRIAFIGTSASGLKDIRATPLDPGFPGVEAPRHHRGQHPFRAAPVRSGLGSRS